MHLTLVEANSCIHRGLPVGIIIFQELLFKSSYQDEAVAKSATNGSCSCSLLHDYSLLTIPSTCFSRLTLEIVTNEV